MTFLVIKLFPMLCRCVVVNAKKKKKKEAHTERMCIRLQAKTSAAVNKTADVTSSRAENSYD